MVWPPQNTGLFEYKKPCCSCGPKFFIPIFTPGDPSFFPPYADATAAAAAIADQVASCIGFFDQPISGGFDSVVMSAVDGGNSLYLAATAKNLAVPCGPYGDTAAMWGCITAEAGETLSFAWTYSSHGSVPSFSEVMNVFVLRDDQTTFEYANFLSASSDSTSGTDISTPLPYTGKYLVLFVAQSRYTEDAPLGSTVGFTALVTSSGALTVIKPVTALYGSGLSELACV